MINLNKPPLFHQMRALGLNVVHPPRASLRPLDILMLNGRTLCRWGRLDAVFESKKEVPDVSCDQVISNLFGQTKETFVANLGFSLLNSIIAKMGISIGLESAYSDAAELQFSYENITSEFCDAASIDHYINTSKLNPDMKSTQKYLLSNKLYVVTEVYKSNRIAVGAKDASGLSLDIKLTNTALEEASAEVESSSSLSSLFQGSIPLTIGIRAFQIGYKTDGNQCWCELVSANTKLQSKSVNEDSVSNSVLVYKPLEIDTIFEYVE